MREIKKQLEVLLIHYFRESYPDFPKGKVMASESPDFVIKMKNAYELGIELTRLNPANAVSRTDEREKEISFREEFIDDMKELFETGSELKLFVKFLFSEKGKITPEREMAVKAKTVALIREYVKHKNERSFFHYTLPKAVLPAGLKQVLLIHHPGLETSVWERSNNLGISNDVMDDIRKAIRKKDDKISLYQKQHLNYYWLLITTDHLRGAKNLNLANKILQEEFQSRFQHVFLFDLVKSKVFELV